MNIVIIAKGNTRRRRELERAVAQLRGSALFDRFTVYETAHGGHAIDLARQASAAAEVIISAGGDGTLNEIVNGCQQARQADPAVRLPAVGVLALGSANDFVKTARLQGTAEEVLALAAAGMHRPIDIGRVHCTAVDGRRTSRYFVNVADIGIGAAVVQELKRSSRRFGANLSYLRAIFATFLNYRKPLLSVESDEGLDWLGPSLAVIAGNGRCFGSGLFATPQAVLDDGRLDITLVGDVSVVDFIRKLPALKRAELISHPQVVYHRARRATISSGNLASAVEADGEYLGLTPASLEILPAAMRFLLPGKGRSLPREPTGQDTNYPR